jgi:hypothetical protein
MVFSGANACMHAGELINAGHLKCLRILRTQLSTGDTMPTNTMCGAGKIHPLRQTSASIDGMLDLAEGNSTLEIQNYTDLANFAVQFASPTDVPVFKTRR